MSFQQEISGLKAGVSEHKATTPNAASMVFHARGHSADELCLGSSIPTQPQDTRFELLWKSHLRHVQQRG